MRLTPPPRVPATRVSPEGVPVGPNGVPVDRANTPAQINAALAGLGVNLAMLRKQRAAADG
jgi:hypothetical protein